MAAAASASSTGTEADAVRGLYERYGRQIYTYCLHQLRNREEAEDATQSTFLNAFRGLQRGVCLTRRRSSSRRLRVETPALVEEIGEHTSGVEAHELIALPAALRALPQTQRQALLLREWRGFSYSEIAEELGLSQAAVETLLFRARRGLAEVLGDEPVRAAS